MALTCRLQDFSAWLEVDHSAGTQGSPVGPSVLSPPTESGLRGGSCGSGYLELALM